MPFWTKERGAGIWNFRGKLGNSWVDEKEQTFDKQILARGHLETVGHRRESNKQILLGFSLSATFSLYYAKVIAPFL